MDQQSTRQSVIVKSVVFSILFFIFTNNTLADALPITVQQFILPPNHQTQYDIEKLGVHVGNMKNELNYNNGIISYSSIANAEGLAALFVSTEPTEKSILNWSEQASTSWPQQQSYDYIYDKKHKKNQHIKFKPEETSKTRIEGSYKFKTYTLQTDKTVWSRQILPLLMSSDLLLNPEIKSNSYFIVKKGRIEKYTYTLVAKENIKLNNEDLDVLKFKITKPGSSRMSYAWLSKAHYYLPVKLEQYKDNDLNASMLLSQLTLN